MRSDNSGRVDVEVVSLFPHQLHPGDVYRDAGGEGVDRGQRAPPVQLREAGDVAFGVPGDLGAQLVEDAMLVPAPSAASRVLRSRDRLPFLWTGGAR
jgi:hypothetical protein